MKTVKEQFIVDHHGKTVGVLLDLKTYSRLREAEEELSDVRAYDTAKPKITLELQRREYVSLSQLKKGRSVKRK
ncbi:MAG: hypothetical protein H0X66_15575 [Verrucomicrobia bacterium]|nr:hypothetical protein [Verrucomicrobiota bacterium]